MFHVTIRRWQKNTSHIIIDTIYNLTLPSDLSAVISRFPVPAAGDCILHNEKAECFSRTSIYSHFKIERLYVNISGERSPLWCCVRRGDAVEGGGGLLYFNSVCISREEIFRESNQVICHPIPRSWYWTNDSYSLSKQYRILLLIQL